jgi:predicted molibdopterin-dependent oxidoreductase YjgC
MVELTIDGRDVKVPRGTMILQAAQDLSIDIPTLCADDNLAPFGACRLCVVEVEGAPNLKPACVTECGEGMIVLTESPAVVEARRVLLDLMISDHPLDCMTCEQAGACKLQDYAYRYGVDHSEYVGERIELPIDSENALIERDMNKCILCGKCVGVCEQVQGTNAISFAGRGFNSHIAASYEHPLDISFCKFCGQCVDICPVGALTNKQFKGTRTWERSKVRTTCPFCGTGCNLDLNVKDGKVVGVSAAYDAVVNQGSLCVKGRFHTDFIYSPDRVKTPLIRKGGEFAQSTWDEALDLIAEKLGTIKAEHGADSIGVLSSARCTNEDNWVMQKFVRATIGTNSIDHCART